MSDNLTAEQRRAIEKTEGNMLVSASAGSGKTFVMIRRLIRLILEGKARVSEILAVTFTEAAATEMKQKLVKALRAELCDGKDNALARLALEEIPTASISTIHKFCADTLRCYFYEIGLDPTFKIADETVADELRNKAVDKVFGDLYDDGDEGFLGLVRFYRSGRSDAELKKIIKKIAVFASSEKDPREFIAFCGTKPTEEEYLSIENELAARYRQKAEELITAFDSCKNTLELAEVKKTDDYFNQVEAKLQSVIAAPTLRLMASVCSVSVCKAPSVPKDCVSEKKLFDGLKKKFKKLCEDCVSLYADDEESDKNAFLSTGKTVEALSKVTEKYITCYEQLKRDDGVVDFSDLEHLTYKLLTTSQDALKSIQNKYKYAFCDEYQDVNGIQEAILTLVSPNNFFMVGDVKQCIYAFRGCDPDIFAKKLTRFEKGDGEAVLLADNFRSTDGVLTAVNNVFSSAMTEENSGVDYASHPMTFGGLYPPNTGDVSMHVIVGEKEEKVSPDGVYDIVADATDDKRDDCFYEGLLVGELIEKELSEQIYDSKIGRYRNVEPKDIAVLLRNSSGFASEIIKTLSRLNIPVTSVAKEPILNFPEIKLLVDLLRLVDYYADDAPLIAVLKSPIGKLNEEELAEIKNDYKRIISENPEKSKQSPSFTECVELYRDFGRNSEIKTKLVAFYDYYNKLRLLAEFESAGEILVRAVKNSSLDLEVLASKNGEKRLDRINRLIAESERNGMKPTVREFLRKIDASKDTLALEENGSSNAVTVMSMHASKGLEFPIAIIAGLGRQFNVVDEREALLLSKTRGFAPYAYDEEKMTKRTTIKRELVKSDKQRESAREEMRLLYVAMTRAQSKLLLVSSVEPSEDRTAESAAQARRFIDYFSASDMKIVYHDKSEIQKETLGIETRKIDFGTPRDSLTEMIMKNLQFVYPHGIDVYLPVKRSVTDILSETAYESRDERNRIDKTATNSSRVDFKFDGFDAVNENAEVVIEDEVYFSENEKLRGIAYHKFLELHDIKEKNVDNELIRGLSSGNLLKEQVDLLDRDILKKIISLPVFGEIDGYDLYREHSFITPFRANEIGYAETDSELLVQGVIDLLAVKESSAIIIDYKATKKKKTEIVKTYSKQLELYKKAVEKTLKLKVEKTLIISLFTGEVIEV